MATSARLELVASDAPDRPRRGPDRERARAAVRELLAAIGEDVERSGMQHTPDRVADLYLDLTSGLGADLRAALGRPIPIVDGIARGDLVGVTGIRFRALCEHHMMPFHGVADVYYRPNLQLAGFGRIADLVEVASRRPQLQESLGADIVDAIVAVLDPVGAVVRIGARHECLGHSVAATQDAKAVTVSRRGGFTGDSWLPL